VDLPDNGVTAFDRLFVIPHLPKLARDESPPKAARSPSDE
jgi:hypothetical protein